MTPAGRSTSPYSVGLGNSRNSLGMRKRDVNSEAVALPPGSVAVLQHRGVLRVGLKGDNGMWRDTHGRFLMVEGVVEVIYRAPASKKAPASHPARTPSSRLVSPGSIRH